MKRNRVLCLTLGFLLVISGLGYGDEMLGADEEQETAEDTVDDVTEDISDYQVGVDDILDISVIKPVPIVKVVTVAPDGTITFPYIGNVQVKGLTLPEIQEDVQNRLAGGYMEYPVVSVSLRETHSKKFVVYGQVMRPGAYPVEEKMTLLRAITVAGGFTVSGSTGRIKLLRLKPESNEVDVIESDMPAILNGENQDVTVLPGDTIVVSVDKFFVYGQVMRPGAYPAEEEMTLLRAITVAGGFVESGSTGRVKLLRPQSQSSKFKVVETDMASILNGVQNNIAVRPGDTIVVSVDKFFVSGQVNHPGAYPVQENMTLMHAITLAGGFIDSSSSGRIKLFRPKIENSGFKVIESDIKGILSGDDQNVTVLPGDTIVVSADKFFVSGEVHRPGAYPVEENMTLLHAITLAGGFAQSGSTGTVKLLRPQPGNGKSEVIEADITAILNGESQQVMVFPGDTIVVSADKFFVYGEVTRPGMYPLETKTTALTAISMAGGFTKFGSASRVKVLRMNESSGVYDTTKVNIKDMMSGNSRADVMLKSGDIVVVFESLF